MTKFSRGAIAAKKRREEAQAKKNPKSVAAGKKAWAARVAKDPTVLDKRWKPGQSGNPNGRPPGRRKPITEALEVLADQKFPGDKKGRTYAQVMGDALFRKAINSKSGKAHPYACELVMNRLDGKQGSGVAIDDGSGLTITDTLLILQRKLFRAPASSPQSVAPTTDPTQDDVARTSDPVRLLGQRLAGSDVKNEDEEKAS